MIPLCAVKSALKGDEMTRYMDHSLHEAVLDALEAEPRVDAGKVAVAVESGVATLSGTLRSFTEKWAAESAVKSVKGIRGLANELRVELPGMHIRDDADVAKTIVQVLRWGGLPETVQAEVHDGYVTLQGEVDWPYQRNDARDMARRLEGVRGVYDNMTVKPIPVDPVQLRRAIESRFQRVAAFDAKNVRVAVKPFGVVELSGNVGSLAEFDEAESAAYSVAGTTEVHNELLINGVW